MTAAAATAAPSTDVLPRMGAALALGVAYRARRRPGAAARPRRSGLAAALAATGPAAVVTGAVRGRPVTWRAPGTPITAALLVARVVAGAVIEEVLWRGPVAVGRGSGAGIRAGVLGVAFVALHLARDGGSAWRAHVPNTVAWTLAALVDRRLRWPVLSHAGYNLAAVCLRPADTPGSAA